MGVVTIQRYNRNIPVYCLIDQLCQLPAFIRFHKNTIYTGGNRDPHQILSGIILRKVLSQKIHVSILFKPPPICSLIHRLPERGFAVLGDHHVIFIIAVCICHLTKAPDMG